MARAIKSKDFMMLEEFIVNEVVQAFPTKKMATEYAASIGWKNCVVGVERRWERIWIVGQCMQPSEIAGMQFDVYKCPTGKYELRNGIKHMIVVEVKNHIKKSA